MNYIQNILEEFTLWVRKDGGCWTLKAKNSSRYFNLQDGVTKVDS